jgi:Fic family protein
MAINTPLTIPTELLKIIAEIDEFKGQWRHLNTLSPERLISLKKVATIESIGSSTRIEGSQLSDIEITQLLQNISIKQFTSRDEQEVAGYAETMDLIFQSWQEINLSENHIKQLHAELLKYSSKDKRHRGEYKTTNNNVVAFDATGKQLGIVFKTASPFQTPLRMQELVDWYNEEEVAQQLHPLLMVAIFTVVFLEIHPFQDGNGRLSRVLTTLLLLKSDYNYVPYSSLESIIEQSKEAYYLALRNTQQSIRSKETNWLPWFSFFLKALRKQAKRLQIKIEKEQLLLDTLPELSLKILHHITQHGRTTLTEMAKISGANKNTLKDHFKRLCQEKKITLHGKGRGTWYSLN